MQGLDEYDFDVEALDENSNIQLLSHINSQRICGSPLSRSIFNWPGPFFSGLALTFLSQLSLHNI